MTTRTSLLIVGLAILFAGLIYLGTLRWIDVASERINTNEKPDKGGADVSMRAPTQQVSKVEVIQRSIEQWQASAKTLNIPEPIRVAGVSLLRKELSTHLPDQVIVWNDYERSLHRLIHSQGSQLIAKPDDAGCRFIVLWILNAFQSDAMRQQQHKVQEQFHVLLDAFSKSLRANLTTSLGGREGLDRQIDDCVNSANQICEQTFEQLRSDPLFPGFKRTWSGEEMEALLKLTRERVSPNVFTPYAGRGDPFIYYQGRLRTRTASEAPIFLESVTFIHAVGTLDHNDWWGQCAWQSESRAVMQEDGQIAWPFHGIVTPYLH